MDKCKRCGLPQVKYPLFTDEKDLPLDKEQIRERIKAQGFKGVKWLNLFKMRLFDLAFVIIILVVAFAYKSETASCSAAMANPCPFTESAAYNGYCNLDINKVIAGNDLHNSEGKPVKPFAVNFSSG